MENGGEKAGVYVKAEGGQKENEPPGPSCSCAEESRWSNEALDGSQKDRDDHKK